MAPRFKTGLKGFALKTFGLPYTRTPTFKLRTPVFKTHTGLGITNYPTLNSIPIQIAIVSLLPFVWGFLIKHL